MATTIRTRRQAALESEWLGEGPQPQQPNLEAAAASSPRRRRAAGGATTMVRATTTEEATTAAGTESESESVKEEDPDADKGRALAILFLAHDGVANPELWERWRASDPAYADRLRFFVFRNLKASHPSPFLQRYDVGLRLRTQWCSASIVRATVESLRRVLLFDPDVAMVYLVSGFDIPIQPPRALFQTRRVVTEGVARTVVPFRTVLAFTPHEDAGLRDADGWSKKGLDEDVRSRVACHVQWCGLSRAHAERVVGFKDLPRLLKLGNRFSDHCCPDEWLLGTILALQGVDRGSPDVIDWPVTDQYRQKGKDQSPILWGDLDRTKARVFWAPPSCYRTFTLGTVLDKVSRQEGNLFFRKVGPLAPEEVDRVLAPVLLPSPPTETEQGQEKEKEATFSSSGASSDTSLPQWEEPVTSSSSSAASVASVACSDTSSYLEEDDDDDGDNDDDGDGEEEGGKPSFSSASSVATASTAAAPAESSRGSGRVGEGKDGRDGSSSPCAVPSTPHKRLAAEAALGEGDVGEGKEEEEKDGEGLTKGVVTAARSLRMVGPPGRCAGGRC